MRTATFLGSLLLLAACGSKGPLTLPPPATPPSAQQPTPVAGDHSTAPGAAR